MSEDEEPVYGLVMPFVVCESNGGPYDDDAFCAGMRLGQLYERMARGVAEISEPVEPVLVAQLDLAAMRHGYTLTVDDADEHWASITLTRGAAGVPTEEPTGD